jgi:hypothetical protein
VDAPGPWHAPCCYWFWHSIPDQAQIEEQVGRIAQAGFGSFQIQARRSFPMRDYLSEPYFAAYGLAVETAKRHGLIVGIYDEYNWQSGSAGGRVTAGGDRFRERHLFWAVGAAPAGGRSLELRIDGITSPTERLGEPGMSWHYEGGKVNWSGWELVIAVADDGERAADISAWARVTGATDTGVVVQVDTAHLPPGTTVTAFAAATCSTSRVINYLDPAAVQEFLAVGYEPYATHLAEHFGSTIRYVFFDQPHANFYTWTQLTGQLRSSIPICAAWWDRLRRAAGSGLPAMMHSLIAGGTEAAQRRRSAFFEHHGEWSRSTFLGPLRGWTADHGLELTGHEVLGHVGTWALGGAFADWDLRVNFGLDHFAVDAYRDRTAVDAENGGAQLSAKLGDSVARWNGRSGAILEQYYGAPPGEEPFSGNWGLTLAELRRSTIRNHLLGMRQLVFHGFYQTDGTDGPAEILANPRYDFPPGINYEPWFDRYHRSFAHETGRLSAFLDAARPAHPVAVLHPLATLLADGLESEAGRHTGQWCENLFRAGIGYDLVPEEALPTLVGRYRALVLPSARRFSTLIAQDAIADFARAGGLVYATGETAVIPFPGMETTLTVPDRNRIAEWARGLADKDTPVATPLHADDDSCMWIGRTDDGNWRIALFNDSPHEVTIEVALPTPAHVRRWDMARGRRDSPIDPASRLRISLVGDELFAAELIPALATQAAYLDALILPPSVEPGDRLHIVLDSAWFLDAGAGARLVNVSCGWERQGLADFAGTAVYRTTVTLDEQPEHPARLELPGVHCTAAVSVNGTSVGDRYTAPFIFEIPDGLLRQGRNDVEIEVSNTAANRYYAGTAFHREPQPSGLTSAPRLTLSGPERNGIIEMRCKR